jgi:hypothetical protein
MPTLLMLLACSFQGDTSAIEWHVPGDFKKALKKSVDSGRLLILKGISFGVDEAGAKCATKGDW